jgi:cell division protein FtsL
VRAARYYEWRKGRRYEKGVGAVTKLNLILFFTLILTALGVVTSQHKARKLYIQLQQEQDSGKRYQAEWGQLRLEQGTWGMPSRIESIAAQSLKMEVPDTKRIQIVTTSPGSVR